MFKLPGPRIKAFARNSLASQQAVCGEASNPSRLKLREEVSGEGEFPAPRPSRAHRPPLKKMSSSPMCVCTSSAAYRKRSSPLSKLSCVCGRVCTLCGGPRSGAASPSRENPGPKVPRCCESEGFSGRPNAPAITRCVKRSNERGVD
jgi:hypothetical protein